MKTTLQILFATLLMMLPPSWAAAATHTTVSLDSLYRCVDEIIESSPKYVAEKEKIITRLTGELIRQHQPADSLRLCRQLYDEYSAFKNDSALHYIILCVDLAERLGDKNNANECRAVAALQCSNTGLYAEAQNMLNNMGEKASLSPSAYSKYLLAASHLYGELGFYCNIPHLRKTYYAEQGRLNGLIYQTFNHNDDAYLQRMELEHYNAHDFKGALAINDKRMKGMKDDARQYAIIAFYRYLDYTLTTDSTMQRYWLCKAIICDVKNAVMDQGALWELANHLHNIGDIERSQRYIQFAWNSAMTFGTRVRNQQIIPVMTHIDEMVQAKQNETNARLKMLLVVLAVLSVLMLVLIFNMWQQHKRLAHTRDELRQSNNQLTLLNADMQTANQQLNDFIVQQENLNRQLAQANRLKEEYVGQFMRLCSQYIDRSEAYRKRISKLVKNRDYDRLKDEVSNKSNTPTALSELYETFDKTFLHLFPHFLYDINSLLRPEEQLQMDGNHLTTQLRIFALIRLGIDESSKIAEFLHYSVNTIYNYRAKVKNGAYDHDNFEQQIKQI